MAVTGQPVMGGTYASGPSNGQYRTVVADAQVGEARSGRPQLVVEFHYQDDPQHPTKNGKRLTKMFQSFPMDTDEKEKADKMRGMWKRLVYDGFGLPWSDTPKPFDARKLVGKTVWVLLGNTKGADGSTRTGVVAIAQTQEALPLPRPAAGGSSAHTSSSTGNGASARRR